MRPSPLPGTRRFTRKRRSSRLAAAVAAAAATVAAAVNLGATGSALLAHTSSSVVAGARGEQDVSDSVGYAGIVFTK